MSIITKTTRGFKVLDWAFRAFQGFQYEVGKTYTLPEDPVLCFKGYHFVIDPTDLEIWRRDVAGAKRPARYAEIEAWDVLTHEPRGEKSVARKLRVIREMSQDELSSVSGVFEPSRHRRVFLENGKYHRDDGPAVEGPGDYRAWYQHGLLHRDRDLPALELPLGVREWYQNGLAHREGPWPAKFRPGVESEFWHGGRLFLVESLRNQQQNL